MRFTNKYNIFIYIYYLFIYLSIYLFVLGYKNINTQQQKLEMCTFITKTLRDIPKNKKQTEA